MPDQKSQSKADLTEALLSAIETSAKTIQSLGTHCEIIEQILNDMITCAKAGGTLYSFGNGGSACDAIHLTEELVARFHRTRPGIKAQHFCDAATITCWTNDFDFESVFKRQVETFATKDDCIIAFSTSGNSENVIQGIQAAKAIGAKTIGMLGKGGGKAAPLVDTALIVDSQVTFNIQEAHLTIIHILCDHLEQALFPEAE